MNNVDPMKKSSIYATFGKYYGEKLYKLLFDCCSGKPGSFCYEVKKCFNLEVTYEELMSLRSNGSLIKGSYYLVTDFQTVTYIQFSNSLGSEEIYEGTIEPMIVQAVSNSELATEIWSTVHPTDIITWKPDFEDREWDAVLGKSTGVITSREDTLLKLKRDFDWRNVIFRRWETINGSGVYDSYLPTPFSYQDFPPFAANDSFDCYIGSPLIAAASFGIPYWLDNTIGKQSTAQMSIKLAYGNNIEGYFDNNGTIEYCLFNKVAEDFIYNTITYVINNDVFKIDTNYTGNIQNNSGGTGSLKIENNICGSIDGNIFDGEIMKNNVIAIQDNTSTQLNCLIWENQGIEIQNNTNFVDIDGNKFNFINNNDFGGFSFKISIGNSFANNVIDADIQNNNFLTTISGKTFTPTASMQSTNPSITTYDTIDGDVEQVLTSGTLTYIPF